MFSRLVVALSVSYFLFSCGLKVGEAVPENQAVELQNTKCLNESVANVKLFFDGVASDQQVDVAFHCFSQVLVAFKNNINGANRDYFAPEELTYFIETNFLKGQHSFRSEFLAEIMNLKVVLLGGSKTVFYKNDIEHLANVIDRLRPEIVKLNAQMKIVSHLWSYEDLDETEKEKQFLNAKTKTLRFLEILSSEFSKSGQGYEVNQFINLIKEIAIFAKAAPSTIKKIETARPFLIQFKQNLVGEGTVIQSSNWMKISKSLNEMYFQILRVDYFLKPLPLEQREKRWMVYQKITDDVVGLVEALLETQQKQALTNEQVFDLISSVLPVFSDQKIDQELVDGFADIKVALLGSGVTNRNQWVAKDLKAIRSKLPQLFNHFRDISALLKELNGPIANWKNSYVDFSRIEKSVNLALQDLVKSFDGEYNLSSARSLLESLDRNKLLPEFSLPKQFEAYYKVLLSLKYILTGKQSSALLNSELKHMLTVFSSGYFHYLEYDYFVAPLSFEQEKKYLNLELIVPKIKTTLNKVLKFKSSKIISRNELLSLYNNLKNENLIQSTISLETVSSILNVLWSNILIDPAHRLSNGKLSGFDQEALTTLVSEINLFIQSGKDIKSIFKSNSTLQQNQLISRIDALLSQPLNAIQNQSLSELRKAASGPVAMTRDSNQFLRVFDVNTYQKSDVLQTQISRTLSRIMIRSFAGSLANVQKLVGLTLDEAQSFFDSVKDLFYDLDLISPENKTFVASRFREANLFVSHANGDQLANFEELTDLIIHIFSGLERAKVLKDQVVQKCLPPNNSVTSATEVYEDCLLQIYFEASKGFESIPRFSAMKTIYTLEQNKNYYMSLLKAAGHIPNAKKNVKFSDANLFPHVVQYIEVIFARYDLNQDNILVKDEALLAFPVFKETIREILKTMPNGDKISEKQLPGVFIYFLKYGRPPKGGLEILAFIGFISDEKKWNIESSRLDIGVIFNFIADSLAKP